MRLTIKDVIRLQKKSGSKVRGRLFTGRPVPTQQWLLGFEKKQTAAWRLCRVPLLAHRAQLDHFSAQKSKPRNGARKIFMTATAQESPPSRLRGEFCRSRRQESRVNSR